MECDLQTYEEMNYYNIDKWMESFEYLNGFSVWFGNGLQLMYGRSVWAEMN